MFMIEKGHQLSYNSLSYLNKQVVVKKNILDLKSLENVRDYGCRILVLSSSMFSQEGDLYIEIEKGAASKIDIMTLYNTLKPKREGSKLNVDVVFVNVINGEKIANVFKKLGVVQVFTYEEGGTVPGIIKDRTREFMRAFSIEMIKKLMNEETFYKSFLGTRNIIEKNFNT